MSYAIDITNGPASFMWARKQGMAALQGPEGLTITPPLPFGRFSGSDVVTLGDGKRRMYTAISHAFNTPNWTLVGVGPWGGGGARAGGASGLVRSSLDG